MKGSIVFLFIQRGVCFGWGVFLLHFPHSFFPSLYSSSFRLFLISRGSDRTGPRGVEVDFSSSLSYGV